jgi:hypothetical protein
MGGVEEDLTAFELVLLLCARRNVVGNLASESDQVGCDQDLLSVFETTDSQLGQCGKYLAVRHGHHDRLTTDSSCVPRDTNMQELPVWSPHGGTKIPAADSPPSILLAPVPPLSRESILTGTSSASTLWAVSHTALWRKDRPERHTPHFPMLEVCGDLRRGSLTHQAFPQGVCHASEFERTSSLEYIPLTVSLDARGGSSS